MSKKSSPNLKKFDIPLSSIKPSIELEEPFGFSSEEASSPSVESNSSKKTSEDEKKKFRDLKQKKAWDLAKAPFNSLFMTAFLLWMSGNQIHIFPIIITVMSVVNPLKAIFSTNTVFHSFEEEHIQVLLPKIVYIFFNGIGLTMALVKCSYMGLLPTTADWITPQMKPQQPYEMLFSSLVQ